MFSKILLKLIDQAIIPALLLVVTRIISIILISNYFNISFIINYNGLIFSNSRNFVFINSYSLLAVMGIISLGMTWVIASSVLFHHEHIKPTTTVKLFSLKMSSLIKNSFEIYTKATIWITYLWLLSFATGLMTYFGSVYSFVFVISLILTLVFTVLLIMDIEKKVKVSKNMDFIFDTDRKFLEKNK